MDERRGWPPSAVVFVALSLSILVFRALHQNLTGDEASTYTRWVEPAAPEYWTPDTNNHVLNSLLMKVSTTVLGGSPFAIRLPALVGGILFCLLAAMLAQELYGRSLRTTLVYVLLVFDPFVLDYLFAARGYSMAMAGQMLVLLCARRELAARSSPEAAPVRRRLFAVGAAAGITSIASYAFIPGAVASMVALWLLAVLRPARMAGPLQWPPLVRSTAWLAIPFLAIVGLVCGHILWNFPMDTLTWGTYSLLDMFRSIGERVFAPPNPFVVPPHLWPALELVATHGPGAAPLLAALCAGLLWRESRRQELPAAWATERGAANLPFLVFCALVLLLSVVFFVGMLGVLKVRLPFGRTALVLVSPLILLFSGLALTAGDGVWGRARRSLGGAAAAVVALAFLAAQRFESFTEWSYDADVREAVGVAGPYMKAHGLRRIGTTWHYRSTGNYYRTYLGFDFDPIENDRDEELIDGYDIYFVEPANTAFIDSRRLRVIFEGPISGMRVAVRPKGGG